MREPNPKTRWSRWFHLETTLIIVAVIAVIRLFYELRNVSALSQYVPIAVALLLIYVPVGHAMLRREGIDYFDRSWKAFGHSLKWFLLVTIIVMPAFLIANQFWQEWVSKQVFMPRMLPHLWLTVVDQLFLVAIPEEIFFRGWLQSRLKPRAGKQWNILGVPLGGYWILTALIFAVAHSIIFYQWWHFSIFFPALLFGWLREKTGSITAPSLFHCLSNLAAYWIGVSYV